MIRLGLRVMEMSPQGLRLMEDPKTLTGQTQSFLLIGDFPFLFPHSLGQTH